MLTDLAVAFAFLTRIPFQHKERIDLHRAARWFPLVGAVVGLISGAVFYGLSHLIPPLPSAVLALSIATLICGGFHQDGLADVADGVVGGWDPEQRLVILKDSRHGTYGVLALVLQYALQISFLASLKPIWGFVALVVAHSLARVVPVFLMAAKAAPSSIGMGAKYSSGIGISDFVIAGVVALLVLIASLGAIGLILIPILIIANFLFMSYIYKKIGGLVGDVLGASEQISETLILLTVLILSLHGAHLPRWIS